MAVTQDSPLGMSVLVSKGRCMIDSGDDYPYLGFTDANEVVTITAADGSNPRIDAIVAYVDLSVVDSANSNNPGAFEIVAVAGTPAGSPNPPDDSAVSTAIGLGNPFIRLAHVTVGAGVTTITTGNVSDQRVFVGLPDGFIRSPDTLAQGAVDVLGSYSTSEVATPYTWIDGKTIYRKTIDVGSLPNNNTKNVTHNITGLGTIISINGSFTNGTNYFFWSSPSTSTANYARLSIEGSNISIITGTNWSSYSGYVTIHYAKTS